MRLRHTIAAIAFLVFLGGLSYGVFAGAGGGTGHPTVSGTAHVEDGTTIVVTVTRTGNPVATENLRIVVTADHAEATVSDLRGQPVVDEALVDSPILSDRAVAGAVTDSDRLTSGDQFRIHISSELAASGEDTVTVYLVHDTPGSSNVILVERVTNIRPSSADSG